MRDIQLFLRLLSERVYASNLRDASDFHEWLFKSSLLAGQCTTVVLPPFLIGRFKPRACTYQ